MIELKLPKHTEFTARKKEPSPLEKLYAWVGSTQYSKSTEILFKKNLLNLPEGYTIDVTKVVIHSKDETQLRDKCFKWLKKQNPFYTDKKLHIDVGFLWLSVGPNCNDHKVEPGTIVLEDGWLKKVSKG